MPQLKNISPWAHRAAWTLCGVAFFYALMGGLATAGTITSFQESQTGTSMEGARAYALIAAIICTVFAAIAFGLMIALLIAQYFVRQASSFAITISVICCLLTLLITAMITFLVYTRAFSHRENTATMDAWSFIVLLGGILFFILSLWAIIQLHMTRKNQAVADADALPIKKNEAI